MYNSNLDLIETDEKRSIIVVGKTGAGKSRLLNGIIEENIFLSSPNPESCTNKVLAVERKVTSKYWSKNRQKRQKMRRAKYSR